MTSNVIGAAVVPFESSTSATKTLKIDHCAPYLCAGGCLRINHLRFRRLPIWAISPGAPWETRLAGYFEMLKSKESNEIDLAILAFPWGGPSAWLIWATSKIAGSPATSDTQTTPPN